VSEKKSHYLDKKKQEEKKKYKYSNKTLFQPGLVDILIFFFPKKAAVESSLHPTAS
jgi:hypothetical protein